MTARKVFVILLVITHHHTDVRYLAKIGSGRISDVLLGRRRYLQEKSDRKCFVNTFKRWFALPVAYKVLPVSDGCPSIGPGWGSSWPCWDREDRDDQGLGQGLGQTVCGFQLFWRSRLQDDGSFLLRACSVRRLVLLRRVQQNRHWSALSYRPAAHHYPNGQGLQSKTSHFIKLILINYWSWIDSYQMFWIVTVMYIQNLQAIYAVNQYEWAILHIWVVCSNLKYLLWCATWHKWV